MRIYDGSEVRWTLIGGWCLIAFAVWWTMRRKFDLQFRSRRRYRHPGGFQRGLMQLWDLCGRAYKRLVEHARKLD